MDIVTQTLNNAEEIRALKSMSTSYSEKKLEAADAIIKRLAYSEINSQLIQDAKDYCEPKTEQVQEIKIPVR